MTKKMLKRGNQLEATNSNSTNNRLYKSTISAKTLYSSSSLSLGISKVHPQSRPAITDKLCYSHPPFHKIVESITGESAMTFICRYYLKMLMGSMPKRKAFVLSFVSLQLVSMDNALLL